MSNLRERKNTAIETGRAALALGLLAGMMFAPGEHQPFSSSSHAGGLRSRSLNPELQEQQRCTITKSKEAQEVLRVLNISWIENDFGIELISENRCLGDKCLSLVIGTENNPYRSIRLSGDPEKKELMVYAVPKKGVAKTLVLTEEFAGRRK